MNPAACARAKKKARLEREAALKPKQPPQLPATPEEAQRVAYKTYRRHTRPYRRAFRGIIARRTAERFVIDRLKRQTRAAEEALDGS